MERTQAADKTRQVRRAQVLSKNVAARDDELEHQVESADAVAAVHDDQRQGQGQQQHNPRQHPTPDANGDADDDHPHVDIKA